MNNLKLHNCFIAVHNHDEALAFYRDLLGLEVRTDVKYEGMRWTTVGPTGQPDVNIVLEPPLADPNASTADRQVMKEMLAKGFLRGVNFSTDDVDAIFEHIRAAGLIWGLIAYGVQAGRPILTFFLVCIVIAGVYGAATVSRRILLIQAVPALVAAGLVWLS